MPAYRRQYTEPMTGGRLYQICVICEVLIINLLG